MIQVSADEIARTFNATLPVELQTSFEFPRFNVCPKSQVPIIRFNEEGAREMAMVEWWLTPRWSKEISSKYTTFNAVGEELSKKPAFRASVKDRRCLVPASAFYEWQGVAPNKTAYRVTTSDQPLYAFAGLWDRATIDGKVHDSCTIVTCEPSPFFTLFHHREAVILPTEQHAVWMDHTIKDADALAQILQPYPDELLQLEVVDKAIGNTRFKDDPRLEHPEICRWRNGAIERTRDGQIL